jgi:hypothetical protein
VHAQTKNSFLMTQNKNLFQKSLQLWLPVPFLYAQLCCFLPRKKPFLTKSTILFWQSMGTQMVILQIFALSCSHKNKKLLIQKMFAALL